MNTLPPQPRPTDKQLARMIPPTRWEIALALFALATGLYFLWDAGSWAAASRFVRALLIGSSGAVLLLALKIVAIAAMKKRMSSPPQEKSRSD